MDDELFPPGSHRYWAAPVPHNAVARQLFDGEAEAYNRLEPLQGVIIPKCFGHCRYQGTRALILENLGGVSLASPEGATLKLEELSNLLQVCYRAFHGLGAHHEDPHPRNFQLVDGKIMVLDLVEVTFGASAEDNAFSMKLDIEELANRYQRDSKIPSV